jgi:hypothetical protein
MRLKLFSDASMFPQGMTSTKLPGKKCNSIQLTVEGEAYLGHTVSREPLPEPIQTLYPRTRYTTRSMGSLSNK